MSAQDDDNLGLVLGVVFGVVAFVAALVIGMGVYQSNRAAAKPAPAAAVSADGASVVVDSHPGQGTSMTLSLPPYPVAMVNVGTVGLNLPESTALPS